MNRNRIGSVVKKVPITPRKKKRTAISMTRDEMQPANSFNF